MPKKFRIQPSFKNQTKRIDVLINMIHRQPYDTIITNNKTKSDDRSYQGFVFETFAIILTLLKCLPVNFSNFLVGKFEEYDTQQKLNDVMRILDCPINQGNDKSDMTLFDEEKKTKIAFSIKFRDNESADIDKLGISTLRLNCRDHDKIGLIVKDKNRIINHTYTTNCSTSKRLLDEIYKNKLLLDETDIKNGYDKLKSTFKSDYYHKSKKFIEYINKYYLDNGRQMLVPKLHQAMFIKKIITAIKNGDLTHLIQNKPRSGKTILMLLIAYYLLTSLKKKKIIIMTSVPSTIQSFINDLKKWDIFKGIVYKEQKDFFELKDDFEGICFTSVQFLKNDDEGTKKNQLKKIGFDACMFDESDFGSSTEKTIENIINFTRSIKGEFKINIFASGTANKTRLFYKIPEKYTYNWDIEDENCMKSINNPENFKFMCLRHGDIFKKCLNINRYNKDYGDCPSQVLIQPKILSEMVQKIQEYNSKNNTDFGYSISSLLALKQRKPSKKNKSKYREEFEICNTDYGIEFLKEVFDIIISNDPMKETIETYIEKTQSKYNSRKTNKKNPKLFIVYLPTGNRKGIIHMLQKTLIKFLKDNKLWNNYYLSYSNSTDSSSDSNTEFNDFIEKEMLKTKQQQKKGCILFLGRQGGRGNTYPDCDVTISLDDGHNLDEQKQRNYRALTSASGKTIGINVDLNIQRTYYLLSNIIHKFKTIQTNKSFAEILHYLTEQKIFIFNPQEINYVDTTDMEIKNYYEKISTKLRQDIKEETLLENIECEDILKKYINNISLNTSNKTNNEKINKDLEGKQKDCPKPGEKKTLVNTEENIDINTTENTDYTADTNTNEDSEETFKEQINKTKELVKRILPILCSILINEDTPDIYKILKYDNEYGELIDYNINKFNIKIDLIKIKDIINNIMLNNEKIVNEMIELYTNATPREYRSLIEKHYLPSDKERAENAEVSTPVKLVDEMLNKIPSNIFENLNKILEPCCGKGNFVLGIFDMFYNGLIDKYEDTQLLCKDIIEKCLYFGDLESNNVFFTKQLLLCHAKSYTGIRDTNYKFNSYVGDTLNNSLEEIWLCNYFKAVIGNPPYSTDPSNPSTKPLYDKFTIKYIDNCDYLLFVIPSRWFIGGKGLDKFRKFMLKRKDIKLINHNNTSREWFGPNVNIEGGVNYFLKDKTHNVICKFNGIDYDISKYECIIKPELHNLVDKVIQRINIIKLYKGRYFGIETNDKRLKNEGDIKCYVSKKKSKSRIKYLENYKFNENNKFWKVITPRANGSNPCFGKIFIGNPEEVHTGSYISFKVENESQAKSLKSYLETDIVNKLLSIRKITQDISKNTCKWIPLVPLDRIWDNKKVLEYLEI
jgi:hypothetical protein